jgi:hypothetical protein
VFTLAPLDWGRGCSSLITSTRCLGDGTCSSSRLVLLFVAVRQVREERHRGGQEEVQRLRLKGGACVTAPVGCLRPVLGIVSQSQATSDARSCVMCPDMHTAFVIVSVCLYPVAVCLRIGVVFVVSQHTMHVCMQPCVPAWQGGSHTANNKQRHNGQPWRPAPLARSGTLSLLWLSCFCGGAERGEVRQTHTDCPTACLPRSCRATASPHRRSLRACLARRPAAASPPGSAAARSRARSTSWNKSSSSVRSQPAQVPRLLISSLASLPGEEIATA